MIMKNISRTLGKGIIGLSISLFLAVIPIFFAGKYQTEIFGKIFYLNWKELFGYVFLIGIGITVLVCLNDFKAILKSIMYPFISGLIIGPILGFLFPTREYYSEAHYNFNFNTTIMVITICLGGIISLLVSGILLLKKNRGH